MKNHQWSIQAMFGDLALEMRRIVCVHVLEDKVVEDIAVLLADLFTTYVERGRANHPRSILAMFRELNMGMRDIVHVHHLKDEAVQDIAALFKELVDTYASQRCQCRNEQRSMHTMSRELFVGMCELINTHDLGDDVVSHLAEVIDGLLETNLVLCRTRDASVQELLEELFGSYRGDRDEEPLSGRELLDDLLAMHFEHRRKTQTSRRRDPHPAMVELLARLDRYGSDHKKSQRKPAPAAG